MLGLEALTTADFDPRFHDLGLHISSRSPEANWPRALSLLETESWPDSLSNAVSACSKAEQWSLALLLFEEATERRQVDVAACNSAMYACKQALLWQHGISLLQSLRSSELQADTVTLATAAGACERSAQWQQALCLLSTARGVQRDSVVISNTVINACANSHQWQIATLLLEETHSHQGQSFLITRNAVLGACSRSSEWLSAVNLLQSFRQRRLQVDTMSYNNVLSACVKSSCWPLTLEIFQELQMKLPEELDSNAIPFELAVSACGKGEQWQYGLQLVSSMLERRLEVHPITRSVAIGMCDGLPDASFVLQLLDENDNVMLHGKALSSLGKSSQWQSGLQVLESMEQRKIVDSISYMTMMSAFERTKNWQQALQLLEHVQQQALEVDQKLLSFAINACENAQQWPIALELLQRGGQLHSHSSTYVATLQQMGAKKQWQQVLQLLEELEGRNAADVIVLSAAVSACSLGSWQAAFGVLQKMQLRQLGTNHASSSLMRAAAKAGAWDFALELFHSLEDMDLVAFNTAIGACEVAQLWEEALGLLQQMQDTTLQADQISYIAAIGTCGKALRWPHALHLMTLAPAKPRIFNTVMSACARSSEWRHALHVFGMLRTPDLISYNTLINACGKGTQRATALQLFREVVSSTQMEPDIFSFSSVMTAINDGAQAMELMEDLHQRSLQANLVTYTAAMAACGRGRHWSGALDLLNKMKDSKIAPTTVTFNTLIEAMDPNEWPRALALLVEIPKPNSYSYHSVMSCCAAANEWPMALQLLLEAERQFQGHRYSQEILVLRNILISACFEEWMTALTLVDEFHHRQVKTSLVTYNTLMDITGNALQWEHTLALFNTLPDKSLQAGERTYNSLLRAMAAGTQWPMAFALIQQLQEDGLEIDYSNGYQFALDGYMSSIS